VEAVYVEYRDAAHEREYYDIARDPYELHNLAGRLRPAQLRVLHGLLRGLESCHDERACWRAGRPQRP
jgi:N-acetylglucosamine-6-sulfatase